MRIYIHIGFAKTGTTWLQKVVFPEWMRDNGVAFYNALIFNEIDQEPRGNILISNETIAAGPGYSFNRLKNILLLFPNAKVIITRRNLSDLTASYNKQMILSKRGQTTQFEIYNYQHSIIDLLDSLHISYIRLRLEKFAFNRLARFMEINPPTDEQIQRWSVIRKQVARKKWVYAVLKVLNRFKGNKLRWLLIWLTDPDKKEKKWYYI